MSSIQPKAPAIAAPPACDARPLWSVMMPVFNRTTYLERALRSVLDQDPGAERMQIEILDNCSDQADMRQFVQRIAGDRVEFHRHPRNLGIFGNLNACIERARGQWVHILHDDDMVRAGFYGELQKGIEARPDIGAAFCRHGFINEEGVQTAVSDLEHPTAGVLDHWLSRIAVSLEVQFCAIVVRRSVYEEIGGFTPELGGNTCDWEMWVRMASRYPVWYEPQILAAFRTHGGGASSVVHRTAESIAGAREAIEIFKAYLPPETAEALACRAKDMAAGCAMTFAVQFMQSGNFAYALNHLREAMRTSQSPKTLRGLESGMLRHFEPFARAVLGHIAAFSRSPGDAGQLRNLRALRRHIAQQWLDIPAEWVEQVLVLDLGRLHQAMVGSGILSHPLTEEEAEFLSRAVEGLDKPLDHAENAGRRMVWELYGGGDGGTRRPRPCGSDRPTRRPAK